MSEKNKEYLYILLFTTMIFLFSFYLNTPSELFKGFFKILVENKVSVDYFDIGNKGASFLNAALITYFNMFLVYKHDLKLNGFILTGIFIGLAFGFIGKNIVTILPFYLGIYIYSKFVGKDFKTMIPIAMLSTSLSPMVAALGIYGIFLAVITGFLMPVISKYSITYHGGYNLYNSGFAAGLLATIIYSIIQAFDIKLNYGETVYLEYEQSIYTFFFIFFILMIVFGFYYTEDRLNSIKRVFKYSGRLVTDFVKYEGFYISIFNMGILGLFCLLIAKYYKNLNGLVICSILTVVAFGGFGKHLKNSIPLMLGVFIANKIFCIDNNVASFLSIMFFSTTLAPIAGKFGFISGLIAGIIHYSISIRIAPIYGSLNLYNNGFAAGLVASIMIPILEELKSRKEKNERG